MSPGVVSSPGTRKKGVNYIMKYILKKVNVMKYSINKVKVRQMFRGEERER